MTKEQIEEYFKDIQGINELKRVYKTLAKKLHPDLNPDEVDGESFKILNNLYNYYLEHKVYYSNETGLDIELEKIISQILHYENITIEIIGSFIWVSGDTKPIKDKLKDLGFKWAKIKKNWFYGTLNRRRNHQEQDMESIRGKYGSTKVKSQENMKISMQYC